MSWKGDTLIAGDSEGTLMLWDLPASTLKSVFIQPALHLLMICMHACVHVFNSILSSPFRYIETPKSLIKKMKFGPGKGNRRLFILYSNRVEIRDIKEVILNMLFVCITPSLSFLSLLSLSSFFPSFLFSSSSFLLFPSSHLSFPLLG